MELRIEAHVQMIGLEHTAGHLNMPLGFQWIGIILAIGVISTHIKSAQNVSSTTGNVECAVAIVADKENMITGLSGGVKVTVDQIDDTYAVCIFTDIRFFSGV